MKRHYFKQLQVKSMIFFIGLAFFSFEQCIAVVKTSAGKGSWSTPSLWTPSGVPVAGDMVTIRSGDSVNINNNYSVSSLTISAGGVVSFSISEVLTITGSLTVNGRMTMNGGDINFPTPGSPFTIGAGGSFTWEPNTNTLAQLTLFTNGIENFDPSGTLIIKKWYDFSVPLGTVVSGNFGNLTLNSMSGGFLTEWSQNNQFQSHQVLGTLTIDQGWIVLDKTSAISNTTIGNISLLNPNSYLDLHGGTHNSGFTINTNSISIIGGMLNGIYDGNGNITLNVSGNVSLSSTGYFYPIYNDGVPSVGNGNATINVGGTFIQSSGDFRAIYNLTTHSAGTSSITINNLTLTGGIFMGHYGCHEANGTNIFTITGDLSVNFLNATDKFRAVGLSQLASTVNNVKLNFTVAGNLTIAGNSSAEFFSQVSSGEEKVLVSGNTSFNGCITSFDYGIPAAAHAFNLTFSGNLSVSGGTVHLARIGGNGTATVGGDVNISGGTLIDKGDIGSQTFTINGNYSQSGGTHYLHSNTTNNTTDNINAVINGSFTHSGGIINFDDNTSPSAVIHTLTINSSLYNLSGAGIITHASAGSGTVFGMINFSRSGTTVFTRTSTSHTVQQVKQTINNGCTLDISIGNIQVASHTTAATDYLKIASGGVLKMNSNQVASNQISANSGMRIESGGLMKTGKSTGLYDGTPDGTINSSGNMNFYLDANSTVEYTGTSNQVLTGNGNGIATSNNHKYGNLKINFGGIKDVEYVYLNSSNVFVRTNLNLESGELKLNNYTLNIESGSKSAIIRNTGYIKSETNAAINNSILKWMNVDIGPHVFPFGYSSSEYIPITFSPISGMGGYVSIATRGTSADNRPLPAEGTVGAITNLSLNGVDISNQDAIDRWYNFEAPGFTANVIVSYRGAENTTAQANASGTFGIQAWDGTKWSAIKGAGIGVSSGIGTISVSGATNFSPWVAVYSNIALPVVLISFDAETDNNLISLKWSTAYEKNISFYTIERSSDGINFNELEKLNGSGNSSTVLSYSAKDMNPLTGISYYRLKQTDSEGKFEYLQTVAVKNGVGSVIPDPKENGYKIYPNPFKDQFTVEYQTLENEDVKLQLLNTSGQIVYANKVPATAGANRFEYNEGNKLKPGTYIFIVITNGGKFTKKLVKNL